MTRLIETLISGLSLGSIYALMALGYTMVYGIAKMLNFAHGDIIMVGAYAVVTSVLTLGMPPLVAILISIAICALLGITVEFLAYRPLRQAPPLAVLITAIGVRPSLAASTSRSIFPAIARPVSCPFSVSVRGHHAQLDAGDQQGQKAAGANGQAGRVQV